MKASSSQILLMTHTLGGKRPKKWYRNHFYASTGHNDYDDLCDLEKQGLMSRSRPPAFCNQDDIVFHVTEKGKEELRKLYLYQ